ncbi:MAG: PLDc N-terminal domain-containing protein [Promethearchaeota archaeon]
MVFQYDMALGAAIAGMYIFMIVWFIINILILIWVYKDAKERDMSPILWVIVVFFCGICGLIIYLIVRK